MNTLTQEPEEASPEFQRVLAETVRPAAAPPVTVIRPPRGISLEPRELWSYRELLVFLIWRDLKVRYKQTVLGVGWAVIQPVAAMVIFSLIFGRLARIPSDGLPYPVFVYAGLLPWTYFATSLTQSSASVVGNQNLVTKVYFPRLLMPLAAVSVPAVDFLISFSVLIVMMFFYGIVPGLQVLLLPLFLALALLVALGIGLWLSALNVRYRDIPYVIPFMTQIWMFASPVIYPVSFVPERWQWLLSLNPMTGVIEGFRWGLLGGASPRPLLIVLSAVAGVLLTVTGLAYFRKVEQSFADLI